MKTSNANNVHGHGGERFQVIDKEGRDAGLDRVVVVEEAVDCRRRFLNELQHRGGGTGPGSTFAQNSEPINKGAEAPDKT